MFEKPGLTVVVPETQEAAKLYGKGTKWCTAGESNNMFDYYNKSGPLYILLANIGGTDRKFQLHFQQEQFMNERDQPLTAKDIKDLSSIPAYKDFLNMMIEKYLIKPYQEGMAKIKAAK